MKSSVAIIVLEIQKSSFVLSYRARAIISGALEHNSNQLFRTPRQELAVS
jgi:hypothetical protein